MREEFILKPTHTAVQALLNKQLTISDFVNQLFGQKGDVNYTAMCQSLVAYHNKDGGSPEVQGFDIEAAAFDEQTLSGNFKCLFSVDFFYTCSDIHNKAKDSIRWYLTINPADSTIRFIGEEPWVYDGA